MPDPYDLLAALGRTADEVAASLRVLGCKGQRKSECRCPLAVYLHSCGFRPVHVETDCFLVGRLSPTAHDLPAPCRDLLERFDAGEYPDLEAS